MLILIVYLVHFDSPLISLENTKNYFIRILEYVIYNVSWLGKFLSKYKNDQILKSPLTFYPFFSISSRNFSFLRTQSLNSLCSFGSNQLVTSWTPISWLEGSEEALTFFLQSLGGMFEAAVYYWIWNISRGNYLTNKDDNGYVISKKIVCKLTWKCI